MTDFPSLDADGFETETFTLETQDDMEDYGATKARVEAEEAEERKWRNRDGSSTKAGRLLASAYVPFVAEGIRKATEASRTGQRKTRAEEALSALNPEVVAVIALASAVDAAGANETYGRACIACGTLLEAECASEVAAAAKKGLSADRLKRLRQDHGHSKKSLGKAIAAATAKLGLWETWDDAMRGEVGGLALTGSFMTGLFSVQMVYHGAKAAEAITLTEEGLNALQEARDLTDFGIKVRDFMIEPPTPWANGEDGGYRGKGFKTHLYRAADPEQREALTALLKDGEAPLGVQAVNLMQDTALRLNGSLVELVAEAAELGWDCLPDMKLMDRPKEPEGYADMSIPEKAAHWEAVRGIKRANATATANVATFKRDLAQLRLGAQFAAVWQGWVMDFRGRCYSRSTINNQREDHIKACFEFAQGRPLGEHGLKWLMIHIATEGDFKNDKGKLSKRPFSERVEWVQQNHDRIIASGQSPFGDNWWTDADHPFGFLRGCIEYAAAHASGDPTTFISHMPVYVDGTCSGVQHYAAALRGEEGRFVNLVPMEEVQDLYGAVAVEVEAIAVKEAANWPEDLDPKDNIADLAKILGSLKKLKKKEQDPVALAQAQASVDACCARMWLDHGIGRSTVKRNVMTYGYSSKAFGFRAQQIEDLMDPLALDVIRKKIDRHPFGGDNGRAAASWMATRAFSAVTTVLPKVQEGMEWLRKVAGILAAENQPVRWTSPSGLPIVQAYRESETRQVKLVSLNASFTVADGEAGEGQSLLRHYRARIAGAPKSTIVDHKAKNGIAANFVHSLDAAHLQRAVVLGAERGVTETLLVHDSFGCHAGLMEVFSQTVRDAFVEQYEQHDPFQALYEESLKHLPEHLAETLPQPPTKGALDLQAVARSVYSFA